MANYKPKSPAFKVSKLTLTTFLIVEYNDIYDEHPFIYVKINRPSNTILIIDTGCGGATDDPNVDLKDLRVFIETVDVDQNDGRPLNHGGKMKYIVALTHCHYDHILGIESFAKDSEILVSGHSPSFISPTNLPTHSLCKRLGVKTPQYTPKLVPHGYAILPDSSSLDSLGVILHTPGHTPDELAIWDESERMLYVGDTLYEWAHIIFPNEGSIVTWFQTIDSLITLVTPYDGANISCGHTTAGRPAGEVLGGAKTFMLDVVEGREKVRRKFDKYGVVTVEYVQEGMRFSLICPERLILEARKDRGVVIGDLIQ
ncbi:Ribonuclease Z/Hydroxyacylglutathione hydrolase-like protein [Abortiporus biennis]